jgi:hypothetical protein
MKNSSDTIGNRTRDLPACSAVPQATAPPRVTNTFIGMQIFKLIPVTLEYALLYVKNNVSFSNLYIASVI